MYEEYRQNFLNYPEEGYQNTYDSMLENYPYSYSNQDMFRYHFNPSVYPEQNRSSITNREMENEYPEIYKIVYPMVKKVCSQNNRTIGKETIDQMVEEVYCHLEETEGTQLNITLNHDVRGEKSEETKVENRQMGRNNLLNDLIRILILRELLGRPGCMGPNCNPRPRPRPPRPTPWQRPPFTRYDFGTEL